jgi:hypothetical protein
MKLRTSHQQANLRPWLSVITNHLVKSDQLPPKMDGQCQNKKWK